MPINPGALSVRDMESIAGVRLKIEHTIPVEAFEIFYLDSRERGCDFIDIYTEIVSAAMREYIKRRLDERIQATSHLAPSSEAKDRIEPPAQVLQRTESASHQGRQPAKRGRKPKGSQGKDVPSAPMAPAPPAAEAAPEAKPRRVRRSEGVDRPRASKPSTAEPAPLTSPEGKREMTTTQDLQPTAKRPVKKAGAKTRTASPKPKKAGRKKASKR